MNNGNNGIQLTGALAWILSWIIFFALLYVLAGREWGKTIIYYVAWLSIVYLVVTQGNEIANIFNAGDNQSNMASNTSTQTVNV